MAEVYRANTDIERLVLLLTLESSGHVFFERVARFVGQRSWGDNLKYFSKFHLDVEKDHDLFDAETEAYIDSLVLSETELENASALIDRCYQCFRHVLDAAENSMSGLAQATLIAKNPSLHQAEL